MTRRDSAADMSTAVQVVACDHLPTSLLKSTVDMMAPLFAKRANMSVCFRRRWSKIELFPCSRSASALPLVTSLGIVADYCNALLHGASANNLNKLQVAQNTLAMAVWQAHRSASAQSCVTRFIGCRFGRGSATKWQRSRTKWGQLALLLTWSLYWTAILLHGHYNLLTKICYLYAGVQVTCIHSPHIWLIVLWIFRFTF